MKRIAILGSTGSIGTSALAVVDAHPDRLRVVGLAAGRSADALVGADRSDTGRRLRPSASRRRVQSLAAAAPAGHASRRRRRTA